MLEPEPQLQLVLRKLLVFLRCWDQFCRQQSQEHTLLQSLYLLKRATRRVPEQGLTILYVNIGNWM